MSDHTAPKTSRASAPVHLPGLGQPSSDASPQRQAHPPQHQHHQHQHHQHQHQHHQHQHHQPTPASSAAASSGSSLAQRAAISVRILTADVYSARPPAAGLDQAYNIFRSAAPTAAPVLRLFGVTPAGQRVCAHVHGHSPYFYVPVPPGRDGASSSVRRALAEALDAALHRDRQRERAQQAAGQGKTPAHARQSRGASLSVANVELVQRFDYYGFHETPKDFWRISLFSPGLIRRAADLLQEGAVDGMRYQPYEAHVPFLLQFLTDYNLQGMNFVHAARASFREPLPEAAAAAALLVELQPGASGDGGGGGGTGGGDGLHRRSLPAVDISPGSMPAATRVFHHGNVPGHQRRDLEGRYSSCALEIDFHVNDILNGASVEAGSTGAPSPGKKAGAGSTGVRYPANPGLAALWEDERERQRQRGEPAFPAPSAGVERVAIDEDSLTANERFWREQLAVAVAADRLLPERGPSPADEPDASKAAEDTQGGTQGTAAAIEALLDVYDSQEGASGATQGSTGAIETLLDVYDSQLRDGEGGVQAGFDDAGSESDDDALETQRMTQVGGAG